MKPKFRRRHKFGVFVSILLMLVIMAYAFNSYKMPLPALAAQSTIINSQNSLGANLPWPNYGQSALGAQGYGVLATNGSDKPMPTASLAKMMAALAVLKKHPLKPGEQGPMITLTKTDEGYFDKYYNLGGSIVAVKKGEKITEYQALEAMLLPSANNMAESLADWAFRSETDYKIYANKLANELDMKQTIIADASGFSPRTVSTARDLVNLGIASLQNPVLARIVAEKTAKVPIAGKIHNVNWLIQYDQFNGIKTGSTDQDGGAVMFSEPKTYPNGQKITLVGVIMGAKTLNKAMNDVFPLIKSAQNQFKFTSIINAGQVVGKYEVPWGVDVDVVATKPLRLMAWKGHEIKPIIKFKKLQVPVAKGSVAGSISLIADPKQTVSLIANESTDVPHWVWRVTRNL